jgi:uroporphyrinogen-III synthase
VTPVRVLVTRPEPDGERTAVKLRARGCVVLLAPLLHVELLAHADLGAGPWGAVAMTSANAAHAIARHPRLAELLPLWVFTVGSRTAAAAAAAGFTAVESANGNERDLARLIGARVEACARLLYLAGEDRAGDLAADVAAHGVTVATVAVYRTVKAIGFPPLVQAALTEGEIDAVLHFSRRSAEAYVHCAKAAGICARALAPMQYCLSGAVAEPLVAAGAARVGIAARPAEAALIDLVAAP